MFYLTPEILNDLIKEIDESFRQLKPFKVSELCHLSALREALLLLKMSNIVIPNEMQKARIDQYGYIPQKNYGEQN